MSTSNILRKNILMFFFFLLSCSIVLASQPQEGERQEQEAAIGRQALEVYHRVNTSGLWRYPNPQIGEEPLTASVHWSIGAFAQEDYRIPYFRFKPQNGMSLLGALEDLMNSETILDCQMANEIVAVYCRLRVVGLQEERGDFKDILSDQTKGVLSLIPHYLVPSLTSQAYVELGTFGFISNLPAYPECYLHGLYTGYNVVCVDYNSQGEPLYMGFNPSGNLFFQPRLYEDILTFLCEEFMKEPSADMPQEERELLQAYQSFYNTVDFKEYARREQRKYKAFRLIP